MKDREPVHDASHRARRRRSLRLAFAVMAAVCASGRTTPAKETKATPPPGFAFLKGPAAVRFLIGKTLVAQVDAFQVRSARYFIDDSTVLESDLEPGHPLVGGLKIGRTCIIRPWKFTDTDDCGDQSMIVGSIMKCVPFRMLAANQSATSATGHTGALRGYYRRDYLAGMFESPFSKDDSQKIVEGNVTGCPSARPPTSFDPIELPGTDDSIALESPTPFEDGKVSAAAPVQHTLVGNSLVFPKAESARCPRIDYFRPDGLYFSSSCDKGVPREKRHPLLSGRPAITLVTSRWKRIGDHFCFDNDDADGIFNHCDTILVSAFPATVPKGSRSVKRLHVFYIFNATQTVGSVDKPALIVRGNPAGFRSNP